MSHSISPVAGYFLWPLSHLSAFLPCFNAISFYKPLWTLPTHLFLMSQCHQQPTCCVTRSALEDTPRVEFSGLMLSSSHAAHSILSLHAASEHHARCEDSIPWIRHLLCTLSQIINEANIFLPVLKPGFGPLYPETESHSQIIPRYFPELTPMSSMNTKRCPGMPNAASTLILLLLFKPG